MFKTTWKSYFKNNEKIRGNLLKNLEKSWNFVSPNKWEPCILCTGGWGVGYHWYQVLSGGRISLVPGFFGGEGSVTGGGYWWDKASGGGLGYAGVRVSGGRV